MGRVTGRIAPKELGEVMVPIRGGSEAFAAYAADVRARTFPAREHTYPMADDERARFAAASPPPTPTG